MNPPEGMRREEFDSMNEALRQHQYRGKAPTIPLEVLDHQLSPIERLKGNWALWDVVVRFANGIEKHGSMQGDGYGLWAYETFEEE